VKRPEQHETDSEADVIFRAAFAKWAVTPSERDYGWDYLVEFFKEHESTGMFFTAQLKGSRHTEYSADGSFISQALEQDSADYLARQLQQPTFLFLERDTTRSEGARNARERRREEPDRSDTNLKFTSERN